MVIQFLLISPIIEYELQRKFSFETCRKIIAFQKSWMYLFSHRQCERVHIPCFQKHSGDLNCQHEEGNYLPGSGLDWKKEVRVLAAALRRKKITSFAPFCECKNKNQFTTISFKNISFATIAVFPQGEGTHSNAFCSHVHRENSEIVTAVNTWIDLNSINSADEVHRV